VGRLVYYKGFEFLIRAMQGVDANLLIIGSGPLHDDLRREIAALGLDNRVTILSDVDDTRPYYAACEIFVLPSVARSEAFGIVQLEAMAAAKPVINTRLQSGVPAVSLHEQTGLTVRPGSVEELREAIGHLLRDPDLRERYGAAGLSRVSGHFTTGIMASRMLEVYRAVG
jgi:glycosyltransferase involved in cell wall biosynthesis